MHNEKECPPIRRTLKIKIGLSAKGAPLFSLLNRINDKIRLDGRIFRRSRRRCSLRAPVPPGLIMENPPFQADFLAFPAALLTSRACPAGSYYGKSAFSGGFSGVPGGSRTHGLSLRRRTLYPAELRKRFRCCFILGVRARFVKRNAQSGGGTLGTKSAPLCG